MLASTEHHDPIFADAGDYRPARHAGRVQGRSTAFSAKPATKPQLYRWKPAGPAAWGMSIDLNACIGCNACVVACQAENNIPVVGKQQVIHEREMHWLRIDRYYEGNARRAGHAVPADAVHALRAGAVRNRLSGGRHGARSEGLNVMVYNRCVGTRFCSNNCPYKVRRFNYFAFAGGARAPPVARNPEVTVRGRGVMEKCTFCLQRIARRPHRRRSGKSAGGRRRVRTACQAACPTQAFTFGNMADPEQRRRQAQAEPARLRAAGRPEHASARDLRGAHPQSEPGSRDAG